MPEQEAAGIALVCTFETADEQTLDLSRHEIENEFAVRNAPPASLYEDAVVHEHAAIADSGALVIRSGKKTEGGGYVLSFRFSSENTFSKKTRFEISSTAGNGALGLHDE